MRCKMKKYLFIGFLFFSLFLFANKSNAQDSINLLQQAADAFANGDYPASISLYEQILTSGKDAFEVYYNLGNAYFKSDQIAPAILNYERAARFNPSDTDLLHNLKMAKARTVDKIDMLPVPELVSGYKTFVNATPADRWGMFSLLTFVFLLVAIAGFLFLNKKWLKQLALSSGLLLALLTLVFFFFGWQQSRWLESNKEAIVFQPSITVSSTPDQAGEELFVLHEGTKVRIVKRFKDWVRIRIGDGNMGWIKKEALEEI